MRTTSGLAKVHSMSKIDIWVERWIDSRCKDDILEFLQVSVAAEACQVDCEQFLVAFGKSHITLCLIRER